VSARPPATETSGLAVSAGVGSQYALLGVQAAYYLQVPHSLLRATPYASVGVVLCPSCLGAAFGVMGTWGRQHRLLLDAFYGTVGSSWFSLHGEERHYEVTWGVCFQIGYEYMTPSGLFARTAAGVTYGFGPPISPPEERFGPALTVLGVGYKLQ
jgi:hypothetical protein